jgi:hypothetical protein
MSFACKRESRTFAAVYGTLKPTVIVGFADPFPWSWLVVTVISPDNSSGRSRRQPVTIDVWLPVGAEDQSTQVVSLDGCVQRIRLELQQRIVDSNLEHALPWAGKRTELCRCSLALGGGAYQQRALHFVVLVHDNLQYCHITPL